MTTLRSAIASLRAFGAVFSNPDLRRLQLAGVGSTLGSWAYGVGLAVYAYDAGGPRWVGLMYFARWGTSALCAPWLSLLPDRMSRRRVMVAADVVRAVLIGAICALAAADASVWLVLVVAVVTTIASTVFGPAQGALLPALVRTPEELTAANAVMNTVGSVGMFAGPALGGAVLAVSGPAAVFGLTAVTFVWSAVCLLRIPPDPAPARDEGGSVAAELVAGFRAVAALPALRVVVGVTAAQTLVAGAFEVLLVIVAFRVLEAGDGAVGWLNAAVGVGGVLGVLAVAALTGRKRLAGDLGIGALLWGVPLVGVVLWPNFAFVLLMFAVIGLGNTVVDVAGMTLLQRSAPDDVLGRVFGILESLILATLAVGSLVAPGLVSWLGEDAALVAVGLLLPVVLVPLWPLLRRIDDAARVPTEPLALLRAIPMFALLPPTTLERLAAAAAEVDVPAGAPVFAQGDAGDRFYVVAGGEAAVELDGVETTRAQAGDFFGEIALLRDVPRTAGVHAVEALRLFAIERDDFIAAVTGHAPSREAADSVVAARLPVGATV